MAFEDRYVRGEFNYQPGVPVVFDLPMGLNVLRGNLVIDATITIAGGTTNGTPIVDSIANLVRRITVFCNKAAGSRYPNGEVVRCTAQSLLRFAMNERSGKYVAELGGSTLGNGAAGVYPVYLSIPIYFGDSVNLNNVQTALNLNAADSKGLPIYTAAQVKVDFAATLAELFQGNDRNMTIAGILKWRDERLALASDTIPLIQEDHDSLIYAANPMFVDRGMPNDGAFTQWLIQAHAGSPDWALADTILNRLEIKGSQLAFMEYSKEIRQAMIDDGYFDPSSALTGLYFIDWTHGMLQNSNAAGGLQANFDVNNPSGSGLDRFRIYTRRVYGLA